MMMTMMKKCHYHLGWTKSLGFWGYSYNGYQHNNTSVESNFSQKTCFVEELKDEYNGISVISLNRPEAKNALNKELIESLQSCIKTLQSAKDKCRVLIVKSLVSNVFCAGADLKERLNMKAEEISPFVKSLRQTFTELERLPFPVISAINGLALGGGLELTLATDIRITSENGRFGLPEVGLAIIPGAGGTQRLPRIVGIPRAKELIFSGRIIDAKEAYAIGLVHKIIKADHAQNGTTASSDDEATYNASLEFAKNLLSKGPIALKMAKLALMAGTEVELNSGLAIEEMCYAQVIPTMDRTEGLKAFVEKRKPIYIGK